MSFFGDKLKGALENLTLRDIIITSMIFIVTSIESYDIALPNMRISVSYPVSVGGIM